MPKIFDWSSTKNIVVFRPDNLGDLLMTVPAIRALKQADPQRKITLISSRMSTAIANFIPEIDEVIEFNAPWVKVREANSLENEKVLQFIEVLKQKSFDGAIIFTVFSQNPLPTAMVAYLAGIPKILGYCRENPYGLINCWIPDHEPFQAIQHEVERQLKLVGAIGAVAKDMRMSIKISELGGKSMRAKIDERKINIDKSIVIHVGVSEDKRQYPLENFVQVGKKLTTEGYTILLTGVESEKHLIEKVQKEIGDNAVSLAGQLSIEEFISLIDEVPLLISNNTGPVHIAAAVQTPVVVLYALTNPQHTPWMTPYKVLYFDVDKEKRSKNVLLEYTYKQYLDSLPKEATVEEVVAAARELLNYK